MRYFIGDVSKNILSSFVSDVGARDFFTHVGNLVSVEQAVAVLGILSPDFIEHENHVFWRPNALDYVPIRFPLVGWRTISGELQKSTSHRDVERYRNNFSVSQFFSKWEDAPDKPMFRAGLSEDDYNICHVFASEVARHWQMALHRNFPDRHFEFEVGDAILDEYGVCLTFWQTDESVAKL